MRARKSLNRREKMARRRVKNVENSPVLYFSSRHFFPARLDFPWPPLSEDGHEIVQGQSQDDPNKKGEIIILNK